VVAEDRKQNRFRRVPATALPRRFGVSVHRHRSLTDVLHTQKFAHARECVLPIQRVTTVQYWTQIYKIGWTTPRQNTNMNERDRELAIELVKYLVRHKVRGSHNKQMDTVVNRAAIPTHDHGPRPPAGRAVRGNQKLRSTHVNSGRRCIHRRIRWRPAVERVTRCQRRIERIRRGGPIYVEFQYCLQI
jgi:hypothetical protein